MSHPQSRSPALAASPHPAGISRTGLTVLPKDEGVEAIGSLAL